MWQFLHALVSVISLGSLQIPWGLYNPPGAFLVQPVNGGRSTTATGVLFAAVLVLWILGHSYVHFNYLAEQDDLKLGALIDGVAPTTVPAVNATVADGYKLAYARTYGLYKESEDRLCTYMWFFYLFCNIVGVFELTLISFHEMLYEVAVRRDVKYRKNSYNWHLPDLKSFFACVLFAVKRAGACLGLIAAAMAYNQKELLKHVLANGTLFPANSVPHAVLKATDINDKNDIMDWYSWIIIYGVGWCVINYISYMTYRPLDKFSAHTDIKDDNIASKNDFENGNGSNPLGMLQLHGQAVAKQSTA